MDNKFVKVTVERTFTSGWLKGVTVETDWWEDARFGRSVGDEIVCEKPIGSCKYIDKIVRVENYTPAFLAH